jgi:hypothetical protein
VNSINYETVWIGDKFYDVQVNIGMSWRDCPFFKIVGHTDWLIGDLVAAKKWLEIHKS